MGGGVRVAGSALLVTAVVVGTVLARPTRGQSAETAAAMFAVSGEPSGAGIYLVGADGTGRRRLRSRVPLARDDSTLASWSPDGKRLVFSAADGNEESVQSIRVINVDGTGERRLTSKSGFAYAPSFSPDGRSIAFSRIEFSRKPGAPIVVMRADGSRQRSLTRGYDFGPVWSPDGRRIAFTRVEARGEDDFDYAVYVMNSDGTGQKKLVADAFFPAWSPDGRRIGFATDRDRHGRTCDYDGECRPSNEIYVMNANGSGQKRLTKNRADDMSPVWSPSGRQIAFASNRSFPTAEGYETYVVDDDSGCVRRITNSTSATQFVAWRPGSGDVAPTNCGGAVIGAREPIVDTDLTEAQRFRSFPLFFLGPVHRGMLLTDASTEEEGPVIFQYSDCGLLVAAACRSEIDVVVESICDRNPLSAGEEEEAPPAAFRRPAYSVERGALVARYGRRMVDVYAGSSAIELTGRPDEVAQMIAALRRVTGAAGQGLGPPAFPRILLRELQRTRRAFERFGSSKSAARHLRITRVRVLQHLRLERALKRFGPVRSTNC